MTKKLSRNVEIINALSKKIVGDVYATRERHSVVALNSCLQFPPPSRASREKSMYLILGILYSLHVRRIKERKMEVKASPRKERKELGIEIILNHDQLTLMKVL